MERRLDTTVCLASEVEPERPLESWGSNNTSNTTSPLLDIITGYCQDLGAGSAQARWLMVVSVLSLNASAFIIVSYLQTRLRAFDSNLMPKLISFLALGDFGWALTNIVYGGMILSYGNLGCCAPWACLWARAMQQFFALSTVFMTVCIAIFLAIATYRQHSQVPGSGTLTVMVASSYFLSLGLDIVLMLLPMEVEPSGWCMPQWKWHMSLWFAPIFVCFTICTVLYAMILKKYYTVFGFRRRVRGSKGAVPVPVRLAFYVLVFLLTWSVDLIEFVWSQISASPVWFSTLASTTVSSQGLVNFIVYGLLNTELRKSYSVVSGALTFLFAPLMIFPLVVWLAIRMARQSDERPMASYTPITDYEDTDT